MKIITDDSVYVQKDDITYLDQTDLPIPESIFMKVFGNGIVIIDDSNRYEFVKFDAPEEIEFFKGLSWMINYNEVKDLSKEEIIALAQSIVQEKNEIATKFNSMSEKEKDLVLVFVLCNDGVSHCCGTGDYITFDYSNGFRIMQAKYFENHFVLLFFESSQ